jgi:hypothetical protein
MLGCSRPRIARADFYWSNWSDDGRGPTILNRQPWLNWPGIHRQFRHRPYAVTCTSEYSPWPPRRRCHGTPASMARSPQQEGVAELKTGIKLKPAGFEFRLFDHFPSRHARDLAEYGRHAGGPLSHCSVDTLERCQTSGPTCRGVQQTGTSAMYGGPGPVCKITGPRCGRRWG